MSPVQPPAAPQLPAPLAQLVAEGDFTLNTKQVIGHTESKRGGAVLVQDTFETDGASGSGPKHVKKTTAPLAPGTVCKEGESWSCNFVSRAKTLTGQVADGRKTLAAMAAADDNGSQMIGYMFDGLNRVHRELRGHELVTEEDTTGPAAATFAVASLEEKIDLTTFALFRRARDAAEAALRYYGLGADMTGLPSYQSLAQDPCAAWEAMPAFIKKVQRAISQREAPAYRCGPGRQLWATPTTNVSVTCEVTRRQSSMLSPPAHGIDTWTIKCEVFVAFAEGGNQGADTPAQFYVPLLACWIVNPGQHSRVEYTLPDVANVFANRGRLRFDRIKDARFTLQPTAGNGVQRFSNAIGLPGLGRALVRGRAKRR